MKAKIGRGDGFRGLLNYIIDEKEGKKDSELVSSNMGGASAKELSSEFKMFRNLRPDIKNPAWHCSLSMTGSERLDKDKWDEVVSDFMVEMGFDEKTPRVAFRHNDTDYDHVHIAASRINIDGDVWHGRNDVYKAIEATAKLEKKHGLILTPTLEMKKDEKTLSAKEVNKAIRTGVEPPRQKLQRIISENISAGSAAEFAEALEVAGVSVKANIASTGKMNGFSFGIDGISFSGSKLGEKFKWSKLQEKGITYEQNADRERLEAVTRRATDNSANQGIEVADERAAVVNGRDIAAASRQSGAVEARPGRFDGSDAVAAIDTAEFSGRDSEGDLLEVRSQIPGDNGREHTKDNPEIAGNGHLGFDLEQRGSGSATSARAAEEATREDRFGNREVDQGTARSDVRASEISESAGLIEAEKVENVSSLDNSKLRGGSDWNSRFKRKTAERNHERDFPNITELERVSARETSPQQYLEAVGYTVKNEGRHLSVRLNGDEHFRCTKKEDGHWVSCDNYGNGVGDNISLVREIEPQKSFSDAVYELTGGAASRHVDLRKVDRAQPVSLPAIIIPQYSSMDRINGRIYLKEERGISEKTIDYAEDTGFLKYSKGGIIYAGYNFENEVKNMTRRSINPAEEVQKRDLKGSLKEFSPILRGDDNEVWIVEGGTDALAGRDIIERQGQTSPTMIVSGGSNVLSFLQNKQVIDLIKNSKHVRMFGEREKDEETQQKVDMAHLKQSEAVSSIKGEKVSVELVPKGKDMAEYNVIHAQEQKNAKNIEHQKLAEQEERARYLMEQERKKKERENSLRYTR